MRGKPIRFIVQFVIISLNYFSICSRISESLFGQTGPAWGPPGRCGAGGRAQNSLQYICIPYLPPLSLISLLARLQYIGLPVICNMLE